MVPVLLGCLIGRIISLRCSLAVAFSLFSAVHCKVKGISLCDIVQEMRMVDKMLECWKR